MSCLNDLKFLVIGLVTILGIMTCALQKMTSAFVHSYYSIRFIFNDASIFLQITEKWKEMIDHGLALSIYLFLCSFLF